MLNDTTPTSKFDVKFAKAIKTNPVTSYSMEVIFSKIVNEDFDWLAKDSDDNTYLHIACQYGDLAVIKLILNKLKNIEPSKNTINKYKMPKEIQTAGMNMLEFYLWIPNEKNKKPLEIVLENRKKNEKVEILTAILNASNNSALILDNTFPKNYPLQIWIDNGEQFEILEAILKIDSLPNTDKENFIKKERTVKDFLQIWEGYSLNISEKPEVKKLIDNFRNKSKLVTVKKIPKNLEALANIAAVNYEAAFLESLINFKLDDLTKKLKDGSTLLHKVAQYGNDVMVRAVLNKCGFENIYEEEAKQEEHIEEEKQKEYAKKVKQEHKENVINAKQEICNALDANGKRPIDLVSNNKNTIELLKKFTESKVEKEIKFSAGFNKNIAKAIKTKTTTDVEQNKIYEVINGAKIDWTAKDENGDGYLQIACKHGEIFVIQLILDKLGSLEFKFDEKTMPEHMKSQDKKPVLAAEFRRKNKGFKPLELVLFSERPDKAKVFAVLLNSIKMETLGYTANRIFPTEIGDKKLSFQDWIYEKKEVDILLAILESDNLTLLQKKNFIAGSEKFLLWTLNQVEHYRTYSDSKFDLIYRVMQDLIMEMTFKSSEQSKSSYATILAATPSTGNINLNKEEVKKCTFEELAELANIAQKDIFIQTLRDFKFEDLMEEKISKFLDGSIFIQNSMKKFQDGSTLLHKVAKHGDVRMVRALLNHLENGKAETADNEIKRIVCNQVDNEGKRPYDLTKDESIQLYLLKFTQEVNAAVLTKENHNEMVKTYDEVFQL